MRFSFTVKGLILTVGATLLASCAQTEPSRFYVLTALPQAEQAAQTTMAREGIALGVRSVAMPKYLDRPQIVTRDSQNRLVLGEFDQWAGRLEDNFTRVLTENLSALLATDQISSHPWDPGTPIDYQVTVQVIRFEADAAGQVVLDARWRVTEGDRGDIIRMSKSTFKELGAPQYSTKAVTPLDYEATVAAMSRTIEALSRDIAVALEAL